MVFLDHPSPTSLLHPVRLPQRPFEIPCSLTVACFAAQTLRGSKLYGVLAI